MRTPLYYGELCAMISHQVTQISNDPWEVHKVFQENGEDNGCFYSLCADAAKIFDEIENTCDEHFLDILKAVEFYALALRKHLLKGKIPWPLELYKMAISSIEKTL